MTRRRAAVKYAVASRGEAKRSTLRPVVARRRVSAAASLERAVWIECWAGGRALEFDRSQHSADD